jgi:hypothetical protein
MWLCCAMSHAVLATPTTSPSPLPPRRGYKIKDAALYLGVSETSVYRAIKRGFLKPSRAFRHPLIPVDQLEDLLHRGAS